MKLQRYAVATGAGLMAAASLTACSSSGSKAATTTGGTTTTTAAGSTSSSSPSTSAAPCGTGSLAVSGSSAQLAAMTQWIKDYQTKCSGATIAYNGNGSASGIKDFISKTSDFAGSDSPLSSAPGTNGAKSDQDSANARCGTGNVAINLPMTPGAIAVIYNVKGVSTPLNLSAATIAKIFTGAITSWDDAAIKADNAGVALPATKIVPFFRSDGSGTSKNFSAYLAGEAKADFPLTPSSTWPAKAGQGAAKSAGVAQGVSTTDGGIGYAELSYAATPNVTVAKIGNAGGKFVEASATNASNFIGKATPKQNGSDIQLAFDYTNTDADAYPASLVTYEIVCAAGNDSAKLPLIKGFLSFLAGDTAQQELTGLGYVPLPKNVQTLVQTSVAAIK